MRLLVVEDHKDLCDIIVRKLKSEGYGVVACNSGEDAEDYINGTEYDAVLL